MKNIVFVLIALVFPFVSFAGVKGEKSKTELLNKFENVKAANNNCGKKFDMKYDWDSYNKIDFSVRVGSGDKADKDKAAKATEKAKEDQYGSERSSIGYMLAGLNKVCDDKDYKKAMEKVSTIVYKPTGNDKITMKGTLEGSTLTLENYTFGSTRTDSDFVKAIKAALD